MPSLPMISCSRQYPVDFFFKRAPSSTISPVGVDLDSVNTVTGHTVTHRFIAFLLKRSGHVDLGFNMTKVSATLGGMGSVLISRSAQLGIHSIHLWEFF